MLEGRKVGRIGWPILTLIGGVMSVLSQEITLFEQMSWSWQRAKSRIIRLVPLGLIVGLIAGLIVWLYFELTGRIDFEPVKILICGVMGVLIFAQMSGLISTEVKRRTFPNQGIWSSRNNSGMGGLYGALINGLIAGLIFGLANDDVMIFGSVEGFNFGLIGGLILWMFNGGATCIQHFNLRRILYRKSCIPWNYARFLDYVSERLLMKKVGGGYVFYHRMLMEHFAQRY